MKSILTVLGILTLALTIGFVGAYSETFELLAGEHKVIDVSLNADDRLSGHVTIVGSAINFSITDPDNIAIHNFTDNPMDFQFTAEKTGTYHLYFGNEFSDESKHVTLNYNAQHYIFGFPQEFILLFIIVGVALVGIVIFIAMSPKP